MILQILIILSLLSIRLKYYEKRSPAPNNANGILKNTTIAVPLTSNLSNFWRTLEISLINSKIELKLKRAKYCVLSAAGNDNIDDNTNIIFIIRDTELHVPVVTLSVKHNQQLSNLLHKESERSVYWNEKKKKKSENENMANESRYFLESNLVGVNRSFFLIYSNNDDNSERFKFKDILIIRYNQKL